MSVDAKQVTAYSSISAAATKTLNLELGCEKEEK